MSSVAARNCLSITFPEKAIKMIDASSRDVRNSRFSGLTESDKKNVWNGGSLRGSLKKLEKSPPKKTAEKKTPILFSAARDFSRS